MEDRELDIMLSNALKPSYAPSDNLNKKLVEMLRSKDSGGTGGTGAGKSADSKVKKNIKPRSTSRFLVKAAIVMLAIASLGTVGVYAASYFLKQTTVYDHGISVGNQDNMKDEDLAEPWEPVPETKEGTFEGGPDDKWDRKEVVLTNGVYLNSFYYYPDYESAIEDTCLDNIFTEPIGSPESICYVETKEQSDGKTDQILYSEYALNSFFRRNGKSICLYQSKADGVADDSSFSVIMNKTANERTYTAKSGLVFTLVDDVEAMVNRGTEEGIATYVMLSYDDVRGYIVFENMEDSEIHEVLELIKIEQAETTEE